MSKLPMYIIISIGTGLGSWIPTLFGANMFDGWSILGSLIGGLISVYIYWKLRQSGYIE